MQISLAPLNRHLGRPKKPRRLIAKPLLKQRQGNTQPSKRGADQPEIRRGFHPPNHALAPRILAAGDSCAASEEEQDSCIDDVARCNRDGLAMSLVSRDGYQKGIDYLL